MNESINNIIAPYKRRIRYAISIFLVLFILGSLIYTSIIMFGKGSFAVEKSFILGIASLSAVLALLFAIDKQKSIPQSLYKEGTGKLLSYFLITRTSSALGLVILLSIIIIVVSRQFGENIELEFANERGLVIATRKNLTHYFPINPFDSWQNTGINVKKGDTLEYIITGAVSPGYSQNIKEINRWVDKSIQCEKAYKKAIPACGGVEHCNNDAECANATLTQVEENRCNCKDQAEDDKRKCNDKNGDAPLIPWPHTDPGGYDDHFYTTYSKQKGLEEYYHLEHYKKDPRLTVVGKPHNSVIGIVSTEELKKEKFNWDEHREVLYDLSSPSGGEVEIKSKGKLWVVINDSDGFRLDNGGLYFLKARLTR